jgi:hypothetical protein
MFFSEHIWRVFFRKYLADCAEPAEVVDEPIREWPAGQVILAPQLAAVRVRVDASAGRQLLDHVPHQSGRDARRVALVQVLRDAPEREAGAEHGEDAVGHIGQAPEQPRGPVIPAPLVVAAVVVDHGRRLRLHHGVAVVLYGAIRLLPLSLSLSHQRLRRLLPSRPHRCNPNSQSPCALLSLSALPSPHNLE